MKKLILFVIVLSFVACKPKVVYMDDSEFCYVDTEDGRLWEYIVEPSKFLNQSMILLRRSWISVLIMLQRKERIGFIVFILIILLYVMGLN